MNVSKKISIVIDIILLVTVVVMVNGPSGYHAAVIDEESDLPIKRLNAGHSMKIGIPIEEALERIRSMPHQRNALIRSLGAISLTQRAGRNLIFRVFLTIGHQNGLTQCTAQVMCEQTCQAETNNAAANFYDTYPTDDSFVSFVLGAIEKGRELGKSYQCDQCRSIYSSCRDGVTREQVSSKMSYLFDVTNYVLSKIPS